jgi:hypothetical protein
VPQAALFAQLAPPPQSVLTHFQVAHVPPVGPLTVPVLHAEEASHQPHPLVTVQPVQLVSGAHGSVVEPEQLLEYQAQSAHVPVEGPVPVPVWHLLVDLHQPQSDWPVQASQVADDAQGSAAVVAHAPLWQVRPEQQSAVVVQLCVPVRHLHEVPSHSIQPQQS